MFREWILLSILIFVFHSDAHAYVRTMGQFGRPLHWGSPNLNLSLNPANSSGLPYNTVSDLTHAAFQAWRVPGSGASFQLSTSAAFPPSNATDGRNSIYFSSAAKRDLPWGVVALTEVIYYIANSQIAEADMVFNDKQFLFTSNPGDTGRSIDGRTAIFLQDVATHEAGHAYGLDHTNVNLSSLIYTAFSGQYHLSEDDKSAIRTVFPASGQQASLNGYLLGRNGGIFGGHLLALNLKTGKVESGALASQDGSFRIGDISSGIYAVLMEPFGSDISSVSSYYQEVNHRFCGSSKFRRRFYSPCNSKGEASVVNLHSGSQSLGALAPTCSQMGNPDGAPLSPANAKMISDGGGAMFGTLRPGETHYYRIKNVNGKISARSFAYAIYSPVDVKVEIQNANNSPIPGATSIDNIEDPMPGGFINYDSYAEANGISGEYLVAISAANQKIPSSKFPAGFDLLDSDGHYLLAVLVNDQIASTGSGDMSSCITLQNQLQRPSFRNPGQDDDDDIGSGCGTIGSNGSPWNGSITLVLAMAFILQALSLTWRRRRRPALVPKRR